MRRGSLIAALVVVLTLCGTASGRHVSPLAPPAAPPAPKARPLVITREMLDRWLSEGAAEVAIVNAEGRYELVAPRELERRAEAIDRAYAEGRMWWYVGSAADLATTALAFGAGLREGGLIGHGSSAAVVIAINAGVTIGAERLIDRFHRKYPLDSKYGRALKHAGWIRLGVAGWNLFAIAKWGGRK